MLYKYKKNEPRWISFENHTGEKGKGGMSNGGAKGHAWEHFVSGEEKVLCDIDGCGVVRRMWMTISDRSCAALQGVTLRMWWDGEELPSVDVPIGDFFCMGLGEMRAFENYFFTTAEGRSFCCTLPMPFKKHCRITLTNNSGKDIHALYYDVDLTLEEFSDSDMYFCARFESKRSELCRDVEILPKTEGCGRFLGCSIAVLPDTDTYGNLWWGEGEVKVYLDGDREYPTLCGTGAEDYIGSAWELGEFANMFSGCVERIGKAVSMYRLHVRDEIYFEKDIRVTIQSMGGGKASDVKALIDKGAALSVATYDNGELHHIYDGSETVSEKEWQVGFANYFRRDTYRVVAYYYMMRKNGD